MPGHGWPAPVRMRFAASGADPAWPVGGADMSEPQDAASESIRRRPEEPRSATRTSPNEWRRQLLGPTDEAKGAGRSGPSKKGKNPPAQPGRRLYLEAYPMLMASGKYCSL